MRVARILRYPTIVLGTLVFVVAFYLLVRGPLPTSFPWIPLLWLVEMMMVLEVPYGMSPSWIEVGADRVEVHAPGRTRVIPMDKVLNVEAHHHWQTRHPRSNAPDIWLILHRSRWRGWALYHVRPDAGGRLLYALYRFNKPIMVYN